MRTLSDVSHQCTDKSNVVAAAHPLFVGSAFGVEIDPPHVLAQAAVEHKKHKGQRYDHPKAQRTRADRIIHSCTSHALVLRIAAEPGEQVVLRYGRVDEATSQLVILSGPYRLLNLHRHREPESVRIDLRRVGE